MIPLVKSLGRVTGWDLRAGPLGGISGITWWDHRAESLGEITLWDGLVGSLCGITLEVHYWDHLDQSKANEITTLDHYSKELDSVKLCLVPTRSKHYGGIGGSN